MSLPVNHTQFVTDARKHVDEYAAKLKAEQTLAGGSFTFAEIGEHVPSVAEQARSDRLAEIQRAANETVFDSNVRF